MAFGIRQLVQEEDQSIVADEGRKVGMAQSIDREEDKKVDLDQSIDKEEGRQEEEDDDEDIDVDDEVRLFYSL